MRRAGRSRSSVARPSAWRDRRNYWRSLWQHLHGDHEILRLAEARRGEALMLLIRQRHTPAERLVDVLCDIVIPHCKVKFLGICARHRHHRELAFPRFTQPPLFRKLLHETGALAHGVAPRERRPGVQGEDQHRRQQDRCDDELALAGELEIEFKIHGAESTSYVSWR